MLSCASRASRVRHKSIPSPPYNTHTAATRQHRNAPPLLSRLSHPSTRAAVDDRLVPSPPPTPPLATQTRREPSSVSPHCGQRVDRAGQDLSGGHGRRPARAALDPASRLVEEIVAARGPSATATGAADAAPQTPPPVAPPGRPCGALCCVQRAAGGCPGCAGRQGPRAGALSGGLRWADLSQGVKSVGHERPAELGQGQGGPLVLTVTESPGLPAGTTQSVGQQRAATDFAAAKFSRLTPAPPVLHHCRMLLCAARRPTRMARGLLGAARPCLAASS